MTLLDLIDKHAMGIGFLTFVATSAVMLIGLAWTTRR